jgi:hypothetical protein
VPRVVLALGLRVPREGGWVGALAVSRWGSSFG